MAKKSVIFNHDAAIDEYMAMVLLTTMEEVDFLASIITGADCIPGPAMDTSWKIQSFIGATELPTGLSRACGWNPFPWSYRGDCLKQGSIDVLRGNTPNLDWPPYPDGDELFRCLLEDALAEERKLTLLINCPLKTLQAILAVSPELEGAIEEVIWMGGAINVPGNLDPTTIPYQVANPTAEWNAFWDPTSVEWIFENTSFPITVFPLDVTDQAPIKQSFLSGLEAQKAYKLSELAYQSYGLVSSEQFYDMWDTLTTSYLTRPEFFDPPEKMRLKIVTDGFYQGTLEVVEEGGRECDVVLNVKDINGFYDYMLKQFKR